MPKFVPYSKTSASFGKLASLKLGDVETASDADIYLPVGKPNIKYGFGAKHIIAKHADDLVQFNNTKRENLGFSDVINYVDKILGAGGLIFFEGGMKYTKIQVVKPSLGNVILRYDIQKEIWTVVTAFNRKRGKGILIGNIKSRIKRL